MRIRCPLVKEKSWESTEALVHSYEERAKDGRTRRRKNMMIDDDDQ